MKKFMTALILMTATFAHATALESDNAEIKNTTKLDCVVPVQDAAPTVKVDVSIANDTSVDFVTVTVTSPNSKDVLFMQLEKGALEKQLTAGSIGMMLIQEGFSQENGVIKKAGLLNLQKDADTYSGALLALGNIYPLSCSVK